MMKPRNELKLYNIAENIYRLEEEITINGGEIGDEQEELIAELSRHMEEEIDSFVQFTQQMDDDIEVAQKRLAEINQFIKVRKNTRDRIKSYAIEAMKRLGKDRITGTLYEVKERKPPKVLEILNDNDVPPEYLKSETVIKIDKKALLKAVKEGKIDHPSIGMVDGKTSLMFKTKAISK